MAGTDGCAACTICGCSSPARTALVHGCQSCLYSSWAQPLPPSSTCGGCNLPSEPPAAAAATAEQGFTAKQTVMMQPPAADAASAEQGFTADMWGTLLSSTRPQHAPLCASLQRGSEDGVRGRRLFTPAAAVLLLRFVTAMLPQHQHHVAAGDGHATPAWHRPAGGRKRHTTVMPRRCD